MSTLALPGPDSVPGSDPRPVPTPIDRPPPLPPTIIGLDLVQAILATLGRRTARTYTSDYRDFARFLGLDDANPGPALNALLAMGPGGANACALAYRIHLTDRKLAPGTIARRLVALRMAVRRARELGMVTWGLDVAGPRVQVYRDTRGPGADGWRRLLTEAKARAAEGSAKAVRDLALVRLLGDLALRRGEAIGIDRADVDLEAGSVAVIGKGKSQRDRITLPAPTAAALAGWIAVRGDWPGPLFTPLDPGAERSRLTGEAVRRIVADLGTRAGLPRIPRPHGLRHSAITRALDAGRDVRDVRKFSRHSKLETVIIYDDSRADVAGDIARQLAED